jgi:hypothetical protein
MEVKKMTDKIGEEGKWRCHTNNLFEMVLELNTDRKQTEILIQPLNILKGLLVELGERASELNDPILNALMCRMTIYSIADPQDPEYNPVIVNEVLEKAEEFKK